MNGNFKKENSPNMLRILTHMHLRPTTSTMNRYYVIYRISVFSITIELRCVYLGTNIYVNPGIIGIDTGRATHLMGRIVHLCQNQE